MGRKTFMIYRSASRARLIVGQVAFVLFFLSVSAFSETGMHNNEMTAKNVLGGALQMCSSKPLTGWQRTGYCTTDSRDAGKHLVAAIMTDEFLIFTASRGNDLSRPAPQFGFPGLKPGDRWCLCVDRWKEAKEAGKAPPVVLEATHISALKHVTLDELSSVATKE